DVLEAEKELKRAIELDPNNSWAHSAYGTYLRSQGRFDEAINENKRSADLASTDAAPAEVSNVGWSYFYAGKYDEALSQYKLALRLGPRFPWAYLGMGRAYFQMGKYEEGITALNSAISFSQGHVRTIAALGHQYAVMGKRVEALKIIDDLVGLSNQKYVPPYYIAVVYAGLGDRDQAFAWLERAYDDRQPGMMFLEHEPYFDRIRSDPRFADLVRRVALKT
ncbi:MAG TPA: tetratricopeptide repeat protein, partial [Pyrinomonadaceae bacterium]|nr:tetratricopeptide repeat protein [Pyrinomonadaceae bacterium]